MILLTSPSMRRLVIAFAFASLVAACSDSDTPTDHVLAHSTELHQYNSCSDLESDLKGLLTHEVWADIDYADEELAYGAGGRDRWRSRRRRAARDSRRRPHRRRRLLRHEQPGPGRRRSRPREDRRLSPLRAQRQSPPHLRHAELRRPRARERHRSSKVIRPRCCSMRTRTARSCSRSSTSTRCPTVTRSSSWSAGRPIPGTGGSAS